jgi:hypothetical protein
MSALGEALPLALSAALYPPAMIVIVLLLTGKHPLGLVAAYFAGAALLTVGAGLLGLALLHGAGATSKESPSTSGWVSIVIGVVLLAVSVWAWRRRPHEDEPSHGSRDDASPPNARLARISERATTSQKWSFGLGLVMYLPSPLYILAIKEIGDSGDGTSSQVAAILICAVAVMLFVEVPLLALLLRPAAVDTGIKGFLRWLGRNGWTLGAVAALVAGVYAVASGIGALT